MRVILLDCQDERANFYPLTLSRPVWELRCGITTLAQKLLAAVASNEAACFVPGYMAGVYRRQTSWPVNDLSCLGGDDLLMINAQVKAPALEAALKAAGKTTRSQVAVAADGALLYAQIAKADLPKLKADSLKAFLDSARAALPSVTLDLPRWQAVWELVLANAEQIAADFAAFGRGGIEGEVEEPSALRGGRNEIYVAPGAVVHPMVVIDAAAGPVYIDGGAEIHSFARVEGPCYVGRKSIVLGAKVRSGNSIGPVCRVGGELDGNIIQGYSNKYHDGFLGHAYVGEWVNIGAMTANSDLRNDYGSVSVTIEGQRPRDTGSIKFGCVIGDHAKTSIGTLFNTGTYVGAMTMLVAAGGLLPKCIPSFCSYLKGKLTDAFGRDMLYATAAAAMARRAAQWTADDVAMWDAVFEMTAPAREAAIGRK